MVHSANFDNVENCNDIFYWSAEMPDVNICIAHLMNFSQIFFDRLAKYPKDNLFTDLSPFLGLCEMAQLTPENSDQLSLPYGSPYEVLEFLYQNFGNRLIWGSDDPFGRFKLTNEVTINNTLEDELQFLYSTEPAIRDKIAEINPKRFLNL